MISFIWAGCHGRGDTAGLDARRLLETLAKGSARAVLERAAAAGNGKKYFPVLVKAL